MRVRASAALLAVLLTGCTVLPGPKPSASPSPAPTPGATSLRLLEADDVQTLDPALIDDPTSLAVGSEIFDGLTRLDASGRPQPALAARWDVTGNGTTYTFHLRTVSYSSGARVRAQDAVTDWNRALSPSVNSPLAIFFAPLGAHYVGDPLPTVQTIDAQTLQVRLPRADSSLLTLLALPPYWLYDPATVTTGPAPAGTGPYRLDHRDRGRSLNLSARSGYWGPRPSVRSVSIGIEPDSAKRLAAFRAGQADIVHGLAGPQALAFSEQPSQADELHRVATPRTTWLEFNSVAGSGYGPSDRIAIAQAIDRQRLTDLALYGSMQAQPATDLLPPAVPGHLDRQLPRYDPTAARQALDQAQFPGPIDLYFSTNSTVGRVARDLQDQLSTALNRTVRLHPAGDFFSRAANDELPLLIDTWSADYPYPSDILESILRSGAQFNFSHMDDQQVDTALDQGRAALSFDDALRAYQRAEQIPLASAQLIPLYSGIEPYLVRRGLHVLFLTAGSPVYRWEDVR